MKILFITNQLRRSGPVNVLFDIISSIDKTQNEINIIKLMDDDKDRSISSEFKSLGVNIIDYQYSFLQLEFSTHRVAKQIEKDIAKIDPDVINTHGYHPVLIASCFKNKIPRVNTLHNVSGEDYIFSYGGLQGTYMNTRYLYALRKFESCIAISETVKKYYQQRLKNPIIRVYNGIDTTKFRIRTKSEVAAIRREKGIDVDAKVFIVVGALRYGKNPDVVTSAFIEYIQQNESNNLLLLFVGKGPLMDKCKQIANGNTNIKFWGYRFDVDELLQCADFSICASSSEGFGLNFIESLLVGVPVISSDIGPFKEFTKLCPTMKKFQFKCNDINDLQDKIKLASKQDNLNLQDMLPILHELFSRDNMTKKYLELFHSLRK